MIELKDLTKTFENFTAVNSLNLCIASGEFFGLLGPNGAGKTTTIGMLSTLLLPTRGEILIDGERLTRKRKDIKQKVSVITQEYSMRQDMDMDEIMEYQGRLYFLPVKQIRSRTEELFAFAGLTEHRYKTIRKLSGGMKRRVGIAQALLNDPEVLVLDEPTSGLDPGERVKFRNLLSEFAHDRIVLISTHIVSDIEYIATCNAVMKEGKIIATGKTEELVLMVAGKVWSSDIDERELSAYGQQILMVNVYNQGNGDVRVRYLADTPVIPGSKSEEPRMEDLYLWLFPESAKEEW